MVETSRPRGIKAEDSSNSALVQHIIRSTHQPSNIYPLLYRSIPIISNYLHTVNQSQSRSISSTCSSQSTPLPCSLHSWDLRKSSTNLQRSIINSSQVRSSPSELPPDPNRQRWLLCLHHNLSCSNYYHCCSNDNHHYHHTNGRHG